MKLNGAAGCLFQRSITIGLRVRFRWRGKRRWFDHQRFELNKRCPNPLETNPGW